MAVVSCVVTGAGRGIGAAIVADLIDHGYFVVGLDVSDAGLSVLRDRFGDERFGAIVGDAGDPQVVERSADLAGAHAPLTGWVNNAGIHVFGRVHELELADIRRAMATDLEGPFVGSRQALRSFLGSGVAGAIVNVSSLQASRALLGFSAYAAAKAGVEALTRNTAVEYGRFGIRVNAVAPGTIVTEMHERAAGADPRVRDELEYWRSKHPLGRLGRPEDVASTVRFLLGTDAAFITGQVIRVDGGWSASAGDDRTPPPG